jgi:hypothetical protein
MPYKDFHSGDADGVKFFAELFGDVGRDSTGPAITDVPGCIDGDEITANGHVAIGESEVDSEGFQNAATDVVFERVVAEESKVPGAAARSDARQYRNAHSKHSAASERIEVGGIGRFKLCFTAGLQRQTAQSIGNVEHDFGIGGFLQATREIMNVGHWGSCLGDERVQWIWVLEELFSARQAGFT